MRCSCSLFVVVCCWLFAGRCPLFVVCNLLFVGLLFVVSCVLFVVRCVIRCLLL